MCEQSWWRRRIEGGAAPWSTPLASRGRMQARMVSETYPPPPPPPPPPRERRASEMHQMRNYAVVVMRRFISGVEEVVSRALNGGGCSE
ncbi:hypothetical protein PVAP13_8NG275801 [Panicum virgatum]|uniref:Uncharacterized protein n=1 Tax=Panicum virgatum TaxID=38727 RepID=A0A8T0PCA5_PANVG|nr:hypothetical protein PVAP13_8NG275801 [Panicum virgatum]